MPCARPGSRPSWSTATRKPCRTDYDTSDRLYFEPLTAEDVIALVRREQGNGTVLGCIVQYGGQTPLKLSKALTAAGIPILGTSADAIDMAEDRERFQALLQTLGLLQPANGIARTADEAEAIAAQVGYPVVLRPSYVLGGRAWRSCTTAPGCSATCARRCGCPATTRC